MDRLNLFILVTLIGTIISLPVKEKKGENKAQAGNEEDWELNLEYGRYLKEVVQALESDPEFRKKLESANVEDIKSGKISRELHFVDHNVRSKLDELKRRELERLRHIAIQEHEKKNGIDRSKLTIPLHIDHNNPTRFEAEDLRKLILQLNKDLEEVDKQRQSEFKQYEMQKEFDYKEKLKGMDDQRQNELKDQHEASLKKHKDHPRLHHPGSKQQLEEVWEQQDHMRSEDFNPKTFFHVHDLDGNGYWDENEVKALFQKELDKMYDPNNPEDDLAERYEEMERMREHVFRETDTDHDNLISFDEFLEQTKKQEFNQDEGWQGLDNQEVFSQREYEEYEKQRQREIQHLIETGAIPPPPGYYGHNPPQLLPFDPSHQGAGNVPRGLGHQAVPVGYQPVPQGYQAVPQGYHGIPQGYQPLPQGFQGVPPGYQVVPQGLQDMRQSQSNFEPPPAVPHARAEPMSNSKPQPIAQSQASAQSNSAPLQPQVQHEFIKPIQPNQQQQMQPVQPNQQRLIQPVQPNQQQQMQPVQPNQQRPMQPVQPNQQQQMQPVPPNQQQQMQPVPPNQQQQMQPVQPNQVNSNQPMQDNLNQYPQIQPIANNHLPGMQ